MTDDARQYVPWSFSGESPPLPGAIEIRPYGRACADLDIDLERAERSELVTGLLCACARRDNGQPFDERDIREWHLAGRLQVLLALTIMSTGRAAELIGRCEEAGCGGKFEIPIDWYAFHQPLPGPTFECCVEHGRVVEVRIPTARDQQRWDGVRSEPAAMAAELVQTVDGAPPGEDWTLPAHWLTPIARALEEQDPLTALELDVECPHCGARNGFQVDLEAELLGRLATVRRWLLRDVHHIALHYHWNEAAIVRLPPSRRQYYIDRIMDTELP